MQTILKSWKIVLYPARLQDGVRVGSGGVLRSRGRLGCLRPSENRKSERGTRKFEESGKRNWGLGIWNWFIGLANRFGQNQILREWNGQQLIFLYEKHQ